MIKKQNIRKSEEQLRNKYIDYISCMYNNPLILFMSKLYTTKKREKNFPGVVIFKFWVFDRLFHSFHSCNCYWYRKHKDKVCVTSHWQTLSNTILSSTPRQNRTYQFNGDVNNEQIIINETKNNTILITVWSYFNFIGYKKRF